MATPPPLSRVQPRTSVARLHGELLPSGLAGLGGPIPPTPAASAVSTTSPTPSLRGDDRQGSGRQGSDRQGPNWQGPDRQGADRQVLLVGLRDVVATGIYGLLADEVGMSAQVAPPAPLIAILSGIDVVVVDVMGAARTGETLAHLVSRSADAVVLACISDGRSDLAREALACGARGLVSTAWSGADIVTVITAATRGRFVRPRALTRALPSIRSSPTPQVLPDLTRLPNTVGDPDGAVLSRPAGSDGVNLTPRELEILALITCGHSNLEIARQLHLSINSVKTYIRSAYRRIRVTSRSQAIVWCYQHGLTTAALPAPRIRATTSKPSATQTGRSSRPGPDLAPYLAR